MLAQRVGFGFDVALARDAAFYLDRALAVVGDRNLVGDLAEGLDRGLAHGLTYGLTDDLARLLSLDLARALDRDLARALDRADALDLALDRADVLDRDLARALDRDRDLNFARARACALARDLAVARLVGPAACARGRLGGPRAAGGVGSSPRPQRGKGDAAARLRD